MFDIKELYNDSLKYNATVESLQGKEYGVLYLVYLGMNNFIVVNNYCGVLAYGSRNYSYDVKTVFIRYEFIEKNWVTPRTIERLLKKHEEALKTPNYQIEMGDF